jgi:hypothetical protein
MPRYRVVVTWTASESYEVEGEDTASAEARALSLAWDEHPFADDYDVFDTESIEEDDDAAA